MKIPKVDPGLAKETVRVLLLLLAFGLVVLLLLTQVPIFPYTDSKTSDFRWDFKGTSLAYLVTSERGWKSLAFDFSRYQWTWDQQPSQTSDRLHLAIVEDGRIQKNLLMDTPNDTRFWALLPSRKTESVLYTRLDKAGIWQATAEGHKRVWSGAGTVTNLAPSPNQENMAFTVWNKTSGSIRIFNIGISRGREVLGADEGPKRNSVMPMWYQLGWSDQGTLIYTAIRVVHQETRMKVWKVSLEGGPPQETDLSLRSFHRYYNDPGFAFLDGEIVPLPQRPSQAYTADQRWQAFDTGAGRLGIRRNN